MSRVSIYLVIFLVAFNGGAVMLSTTGVDNVIGIGADIDGDETSEIEKGAEDPQVGSGSGGIVGLELYAVLGNVLSSILSIQPAMNMLLQAGVPLYLIAFANAVIGVIIGIDLISFVRGFDL